MKAGVVHCRCSKCYSVPARKRVRKRTPALTLLSLPEEVLLCVLQCLSAEDLLSVRAVHSQLRDIVDNHSSVWARVSFRDTWPSPNSLWLFERAAEKGNFEAAVKLGIAYLYNEGPLLSDEGRADVCGRKASHFFSLAESLRSPLADPFIWVFIRPPWSPTGSCCKAVVFDRLKAECDSNVEKRGPLLHCLARVLQLFEEDERHSNAISMLEQSSQAGCLQSSYLLWENNRKAAMADPGRYLQCVRTLRDYAGKGCWEAQLSLAKVCSSGNPLGLESKACSDLVAQLFSSSNPATRHCTQGILRRGIKDTMRYILVDWLVEVTTMKDFSSLTLHVTVGCVDRYLALRSVPKARLQLLGIACMVVCTRYISKEILTIREAVWLTDNTYKYEDLVRMMGEVVSVLEGKIRSPTLLDYGEVLLSLLPLERRTTHLFSYICELSLLYSALATPPPSKLACAALLLTRALHHYAPLWPSQLVDYTGFSKQDLVSFAVLLYVKCFSQDVPKDYRHVSLTGVKQRFEDEAYQHISKEKVMDFKELCQILEIPEVEPQMEPPSPTGQPADIHTFLASPSSTNKRRRDDTMQANRAGFVTTPTAELSNQEETLLGDILDWSLDTSCSGYEGDQEEESEGEKDCDSSMIPIKLHLLTDEDKKLEHCRALSSDEDSFCEADREVSKDPHGQEPISFSSGYSSVQSVSPSSTCSSSSPLMPCTFKTITGSLGAASVSAQPGFRLLVPMQRPRGTSSKQVKRKNSAAHSGGEVEREEEEGKGDKYSANAGFLSL
ncbi:LOW QUALITY PROTEIN: cyclin-F [Dicentrarchus labrax]|uniref:LOW QUALITY PROTEIN: cyclin-F n=1 Tax=Dicentrarchus labrax TaxID=13489 RepID=UPI0021F5BC06|nr:LOW QUALITY PROTEIN: cyclin-F [Dicentrarchus labrax]